MLRAADHVHRYVRIKSVREHHVICGGCDVLMCEAALPVFTAMEGIFGSAPSRSGQIQEAIRAGLLQVFAQDSFIVSN